MRRRTSTIRSSPHVGFSAAIRRIKRLTCTETGGIFADRCRAGDTVQKISPSAAAVLTLALGFMGAPYSAYGQLPTPSVTLTSSPNPSQVGEPVTFTATVSPPQGPTPQGSITISEYPANSPAINYGTVNLKNGVAMVTTSNLTVGTHLIWATYGGQPDVYNGA